LTLTINGKGNFILFGAPSIPPGKGIDFFEPVVKDELHKETAPEEGKRVYEYGFTTNSAGRYSISPVSFGFFDVSTRSFKVISSDSLSFVVIKPLTSNSTALVNRYFKKPAYWWWLLLLFAIGASLTAYLYVARKIKPGGSTIISGKRDYAQEIINLPHSISDKQTCFELLKILSDFARMNEARLNEEQHLMMQSMRSDCQLMLYSDISAEGRKEELKRRALAIVNET
jgi:hypothetical protein